MNWTIHQYISNGQVNLSVLFLEDMPVVYVTNEEQISDEILQSKDTRYLKTIINT